MDAERYTLHLWIEGRVQGVGFRAFVELQARGHGLTGWVRNRRDGAVEIVLCGPRAQVAAVVDRCRRGPPAARVEILDDTAADHNGFEVRATV